MKPQSKTVKLSHRKTVKLSHCARLPLIALLPLALAAGACTGEEGPDQQQSNLTELGAPLDCPADGCDGTVLTRNEDAFKAKLQLIDRAGQNDTLDLSYYIFEDDEASSLMVSRLIKAAQRGAKIRVIVDYWTNFKHHYFYQLIQRRANDNQNGGGIEFSYYNVPPEELREDFRYLVTPCSLPDHPIVSDECTADRHANKNTAESAHKASMLMTGLFARSQEAMMAGLGDVIAQYEKAAEGGSDVTDEEKQAALKGMKLVYSAKIKGSLGAKFALLFLASQLSPITSAFSSANVTGFTVHKEEWEHITDYTHQKLLLRTNDQTRESEMILGGRNVENSYHLSELSDQSVEYTLADGEVRTGWKPKYIFIDVDFHSRFYGTSVRERFEHLWGFDEMVVNMNDVEALGVIPDLVLPAEDGSGDVRALDAYGGPDSNYIEAAVARLQERWSYDEASGEVTPLQAGPTYNVAKTQFPALETTDANARFYYIENVPNPGGVGTERVFGAPNEWRGKDPVRQLMADGKRIHATWLNELNRLCDGSEPKEVIFHNAYLMMPTQLQMRIYEGIRDPSSCEGVSKFTIITNSRLSTDLNIINVFNESYIQPLLQDPNAAERLEYREHITDDDVPSHINADNPSKRSLHAKVMIFGDNIFIGSANGDGRSKFMDANNGIMIENAPKLVQQYKDYINTTVHRISEVDPHHIATTPPDVLREDNMAFFEEQILSRWLDDRDELRASLREYADRMVRQMYEGTAEAMPDEDEDALALIDQSVELL